MNEEIRYIDDGSYIIGSLTEQPVEHLLTEADHLGIEIPEDILSKYSMFNKIGFLYTLFVKNEHRGRKIGKKLVNRFCWEIELKGSDIVVGFADLKIEQRKGFELLKFYEKQGFEVIKVIGDYALIQYKA